MNMVIKRFLRLIYQTNVDISPASRPLSWPPCSAFYSLCEFNHIIWTRTNKKNLPDGDGHGSDPELDLLPGAEVDGDECKPDDAGRVHREPDELGLVERLGDFAREDGVHRADHHQQDGVRERNHVRCVDGSLKQKIRKQNNENIFLATSMSNQYCN